MVTLYKLVSSAGASYAYTSSIGTIAAAWVASRPGTLAMQRDSHDGENWGEWQPCDEAQLARVAGVENALADEAAS